MSQKQKLAELRQQLERWRSYNEVHAKPADKILYEFLSELLKLGEEDEEKESVQFPIDNYTPKAQSAAEGGEGGNSPEGSPDLP